MSVNITLDCDQTDTVVVQELRRLVQDLSETLDMHEAGRSDDVTMIFTNDPVQEIVQISELVDSCNIVLDWYT